MGGRQYWEGGGIGREAVLGGRRYWEEEGIGRDAALGGRRYWEEGGIGRDDCTVKSQLFLLSVPSYHLSRHTICPQDCIFLNIFICPLGFKNMLQLL